jgi:quinol monooxygenase YgiN
MVQLVIRIPAKPARSAATADALLAVIRDAHVDGDCLDAHASVDVVDAHVVWYWEQWPDTEAFEARVRSERFRSVLAVMETAASAPLFTCQFITESRGFDYVAAIRGAGERFASGRSNSHA